MTNYKTLQAWQISMDLVQSIYNAATLVPKDEQFGLTTQLKRAVVSIPTNIAEGLGRKHKKDSAQFFAIARGSAYEVETLITIAQRNGWVNIEVEKSLSDLLSRSLQLINGLIRHYEDAELK